MGLNYGTYEGLNMESTSFSNRLAGHIDNSSNGDEQALLRDSSTWDKALGPGHL